MRNPTLAATAMLLAGPIFAQESGGVVTLTTEGETYEMMLLAENAHWIDQPGVVIVSLYATTDAGNAPISSIEITAGTVQGNVMPNPLFRAWVDGAEGLEVLTTAEEAPSSVTIEEMAEDGDILTVSGTFEGVLSMVQEGVDTRPAETPREVSGRFDVQLDLFE